MPGHKNSQISKRLAAGLQACCGAALLLGARLTQAQAGPCLPAPSGLVGWWRGDGNALDSVGTNHGVWTGAAAYAPGQAGQAFSFNGSGSVVQIPDSPALDFDPNGAFTVELWTYYNANIQSYYLLTKESYYWPGNSPQPYVSLQYQLGINAYGGGIYFLTLQHEVATQTPLPPNAWSHLAATCDGSTLCLYLNGQLVATAPGSLGASNNGPLTLGGTLPVGSPSFGGALSEISLYQRALSAGEIQSIYAAGSAGKCLPPPAFLSQPQPTAQTNGIGAGVAIAAVAVGGQPLAYQWLFNGTNLPGATQATLNLANLVPAQSGTYALTVSNAFGGVVSSNATLVVAPIAPPICSLADLTTAVANGGTYTFGCDATIVPPQTLTNAVNLTLDGWGHNVVISGNQLVRLFAVNAGVNLTLRNLTIANGSNVGADGSGANIPGASGFGGGIANFGGNLTLVNCTFSGHRVAGGGSYSLNGGARGGDAFGAAVYNIQGSLNATNTLFATNTAKTVIVQGGLGGNALGGAIYNRGGILRFENCQFLANQVLGGTGQFSSGAPFDRSGGGYGGGLSTTNADVTLSLCTFANNRASSLLNQDPNGSNLLNPPGGGGGVHHAGGVLRVVGCLFATNTVVGPGDADPSQLAGGNGMGGAILNFDQLAVTNSSFLGNRAQGGPDYSPRAKGMGGGLANFGAAYCVNSSFLGNTALGASAQGPANSGTIVAGAGVGGGIYNSNTLWLLDCTLAGNTATGGTGGWGGNAYGGGLCNQGQLTATNNTLAGNVALGGPGGIPFYASSGPNTYFSGGNAYGGAVCNNGGGAWFAFTTISSNSVAGGAGNGNSNGTNFGGGLTANAGTLTLVDSIVAYSTAGNCYGAITDAGYNLNSDATGQFTGPGSRNNTDPLLGPLANNGGPTLTCALLAGSPALDAAGAPGAPATDQRGAPRPYGAGYDVGAYEATNAPMFFARGSINGYLPPGGVTLATSAASTLADARGQFTLNNLPAGTYTLTPTAAGALFVPASLSLTVGPNQTNLQFQAYPFNLISGLSLSNGILQTTFAGTNGQRAALDTSADLRTWTPLTTNLIGATGLLNLSLTNHPGQKTVFYRLRSF